MTSSAARTPGVARFFEKFAHAGAMPVAIASLAVGLAAGAAALTGIIGAPEAQGLFGACLALIVLTIALEDWRQFRIPDSLSGAAVVLGLLYAVVEQPSAVVEVLTTTIVRGLLMALLLLAVRDVYARVRGRQGLGLGDVKLAGVAGIWLDWLMLPIVIEIAAVAALSVFIVRRWVLGQPVKATSRIPFGLFLAPAIWICWVLEIRLAPV